MLNTFETNSVFPRVNIYMFPSYFNIFVPFVAFCSKTKSSKKALCDKTKPNHYFEQKEIKDLFKGQVKNEDLDYHRSHGLRGNNDYGYIEDHPFRYHILRP